MQIVTVLRLCALLHVRERRECSAVRTVYRDPSKIKMQGASTSSIVLCGKDVLNSQSADVKSLLCVAFPPMRHVMHKNNKREKKNEETHATVRR